MIASPLHRALPDAYVSAFLLRELLEVATVEDLIGWTEEPVLLPRVNFGQHRGCAWDAVPLNYLEWVADRSELNDDIRCSARHHRRLRLGQVMVR